MKSEFWDEQFEIAAKSPAIWALEGRRLKRSGDLVFDAYARDLDAMTTDRSPLELENLETVGAATLLYGLAFENILKATIVQREGVKIEGGKIVGWPAHHQLTELANRAKVALTAPQRDLLVRLTAFVEWGGRYPIPKTPQKIPLKQAGVSPEWFPLPVQPYERAMLSDLYRALEAAVLQEIAPRPTVRRFFRALAAWLTRFRPEEAREDVEREPTMPRDVVLETSRKELFEVLQVAEARRRYHHNALWEEQKHFTWWVALIVPAVVGLHLQGPDMLSHAQKAGLMVTGCALGIVIACIAIYVISREAKSFRKTVLTVNRAAHALGLDQPQAYNEGPLALLPAYPLREQDFPREFGVRHAFQFMFFVAILLFLGLAVWACSVHGAPHFWPLS